MQVRERFPLLQGNLYNRDPRIYVDLVGCVSDDERDSTIVCKIRLNRGLVASVGPCWYMFFSSLYNFIHFILLYVAYNYATAFSFYDRFMVDLGFRIEIIALLGRKNFHSRIPTHRVEIHTCSRDLYSALLPAY